MGMLKEGRYVVLVIPHYNLRQIYTIWGVSISTNLGALHIHWSALQFHMPEQVLLFLDRGKDLVIMGTTQIILVQSLTSDRAQLSCWTHFLKLELYQITSSFFSLILFDVTSTPHYSGISLHSHFHGNSVVLYNTCND
ncbi:hypothetical protein ACJX0J_025536 [Zea mays]